MYKYLAITFLAGALGLAGCATDPKAASEPRAAKDEEVITGSRIPRKGSTDQPVTSVSGEAWRRESSTVIGNMPRGN